MPKVHKAKAAKDYPAYGIKKGDTYYHWAFFRGRKQMSKTMPKRSQTTAAPNLSAAYAVQEALEDALAEANTREDVKAALDAAVESADEVLNDYDESISNLEQAFPGGCPALEEKQEQRDQFDGWKEELDSASGEIDESLDEFLDEEVRKQAWIAKQEAEHEDEDDYEVDEDDFELPTDVGWDDLSAEEQEAAKEDALEKANNVSFPL